MSSHHRKHLANYLASKKSGQQSNKSASRSNSKSPGKYSVLPDISTLSVSVKAKKFSAMNTRSAHSQTQPRVLTRKSGKAGILDLPDELLLTIFSYLSAMDLISASQVCSRWNPVANDNVLWASVYKTYGSKGEAKKGKDDTTNYKRQCLKSCVQMRNRQCQRLIKKINPFTGLPRDTEKALRVAGVTFQLSLVDRSDKERVMESKDMIVHQMSFTVRWYDLEMPALTSLNALNFYSVNPLFFTAEGKAVSNGPTSKSLLVHVDLAWTKWLQSNKPAGSDGMVSIYNLPEGLAIATWKEDGGVAFFCLGLHFNQLLQRCLQGSSVSPFDVNRHTLITDDIDSAYGLHDYQCTVDIRTARQSIWSQQFSNLSCKKESIEGSKFAVFPLIRKDHHCDHVILQKKLQFPWKTDAFKGILEDVVWIDLVVLDERQEPFWCISSLCEIECKQLVSNHDFDYSGEDAYIMTYKNDRGKLEAVMNKTDNDLYFMTQLNLKLSLDAINQWFGTSYR